MSTMDTVLEELITFDFSKYQGATSSAKNEFIGSL
jgi:hypothetical protein